MFTSQFSPREAVCLNLDYFSLHFDQHILSASKTEFGCVVETEGPVGVGMDVTEFFTGARIFFVGEDGSIDSGGGIDRVDAGLIEGDGIGAREDADVGDDGRVVVRPAVAVRGYVHHEADMERGFSVKDGFGVFGDALAAHAACVSVG